MTPIRFDLNSPEVIADPYPHYARLREDAPVHHDRELDLWVLSRHDDVAAAVRDHARFSSESGGPWSDLSANPFNPSTRVPAPVAAAVERLLSPRVLLTSDPPDHTELRRKVAPAFTPRRIAAWEPRVREITEGLLGGAAARDGRIDLVRALAAPLPSMVIAEMMGVPPGRRDRFRRWSDEAVDGLLAHGSLLRTLHGTAMMSAHFAAAVRRRRRDPRDDLIGLLVAGGDEAPLSTGELVTFCVLLLVAGNETTTNLISNTVLALLENPDALEAVRADPGLAGAAVEETLRYDGPAQGLLRIAKADARFGDVTIPAGSRVLLLIASANRDPRRHPDPDAFRLDRGRADHLAFGTGVHYCIGHALARLESTVAIESLFRLGLAPRLAGRPGRLDSPVLRGLRTLPLALERVPAGR
ncbi:cytochrome P450 [Actinomadura parmotrematis]|uniref:Cytochrome P450 n=1 Tax=Actinomadura parmotrematis TaxID=2864039 RepID=A0ABS7FZX4_9ACTN|nr:cytochrome P450 [Actinomadura parmotrematis]MBW8485695.1 cytochrome P450 [Actinomadura parmotrematis]